MNRGTRATLGLATLLLLVAACGIPSERAAAVPPVDYGPILHQQARDDLARYDKAFARAGGGKVVIPEPSADPYADWRSTYGPDISPVGESFDSATVSADGLRLTVGFTGAQDPATVPCGVDYAAEA